MDRQLVKQLRADMQSVLDASDLSKNLTIEVGNATFDDDTVTFKVVLKKEGALSKEAKDLVGMAGLHQLSAGAEEAGQFSAAINAEKIRSALGGLTIDRRENINTMDQLSRDEITARLALLQKQYPQAFLIEGQYKDITDEQGTRSELLEHDKAELTKEVLRNED